MSDPSLSGDQMNQDIGGSEIGNRRDYGRCRNTDVLKSDHLSHDESAGAHDRGHDLPAGGSYGLDCACFLRSITGLLHQRNGEHAGTGYIGNRGTGDHSHQAGRKNRSLCRTADRLVGKLETGVNQHSSAAAVGEEGAEQQEIEQGIEGGAERRSENTVCSQHERLTETVKGNTLIMHDARNKLSEPGVGHEEENDAEQGQTDHAAHSFQNGDQQEDRYDDLMRRHGRYGIHAVVQVFRVRHEILENDADHHDQGAVDNPQPVFLILVRQRIHQEYHIQGKA